MSDESNDTNETDDSEAQERESPPAPHRYDAHDRREIDVRLVGVRMPDFPPETAGSLASDILLTIRGEYGISAFGVDIDHPNANVRYFYDGGPVTVDWHDQHQRAEYRSRPRRDERDADDEESDDRE